VRIVYTAEHLSLAALEKLVHVDPDLLPERLAAFEIELPDEVQREVFPVARLPADWRSEPPAEGTQEIGRAWLADSRRPGVLVVPSAVIPGERNYLLNPLHSEAARWAVVGSEPFRFDPRLVAGRRTG
jgi:RES domain-containing protein